MITPKDGRPLIPGEIVVTIKSVFGVDRTYPVCERAKLFTEIAGTKTMDKSVINRIKQLGYNIKIDNLNGDYL